MFWYAIDLLGDGVVPQCQDPRYGCRVIGHECLLSGMFCPTRKSRSEEPSNPNSFLALCRRATYSSASPSKRDKMQATIKVAGPFVPWTVRTGQAICPLSAQTQRGRDCNVESCGRTLHQRSCISPVSGQCYLKFLFQPPMLRYTALPPWVAVGLPQSPRIDRRESLSSITLAPKPRLWDESHMTLDLS